jgi:2Fe-2S ferredoxin
MPDISFIQTDGTEQGFEAPAGISAMQAATSYGVVGIVGECGGSMNCATCHVYVDAAWAERLPAPQLQELEMLDCTAAERRDTSRLCCQIALTPEMQGLVLHVPDRQY